MEERNERRWRFFADALALVLFILCSAAASLSPRFPFLGFSMGTGHFTAMVWKATRRLGCAKGNCPGQNLWVCQYDPPGNMMGAFPQNVPPPL